MLVDVSSSFSFWCIFGEFTLDKVTSHMLMETNVGCKVDPDIQAHTLADTHKSETARVAKIF